MAIIRRWQAGFESNGTGSASELHGRSSTSRVSVVDYWQKTGSYAMRIGYDNYFWVNMPATKQIRAAGHFAYPLRSVNSLLFMWRDATSELGRIWCSNTDSNTLKLKILGTDQDTEIDAIPINTRSHIGINIKIHSSAGWVSLYVDGVKVLTFVGNTGSTDLTQVRYYGMVGGINYNFWDDCFVDDTDGESDAVVPDLRFPYKGLTGAGNYSQMSIYPDSGEGHYEDVDDIPHDSDGTYVFADAVDERDTFAMADVTLPSGANINAVIAHAYARKTNAAVATQMAPACRENAVDATGSAQDLGTSYGLPIWTRWTTAPDTDAWTETNWNAAEIGVVGKGVYS